jgi:hypothetical protein
MSHELWFHRGLWAAILLAAGVAISPSLADPDLWGHVQYGRDVLASGRLPETTTYSFIAEGYPWINHENIAELALALGADTIGPVGLLVVKCLLGVVAIGLMMRYGSRRGAGTVTLAAVALLVAVNLAFHWSMRPQLFTYTFFTFMIALFGWCFEGWENAWRLPWLSRQLGSPDQPPLTYSVARLKWLWVLVPLFAIWANAHGGFVAGFCILTAYLGLRSLEIVAHRGLAAWGLVLRLAMMACACGLATFVNPYGPMYQVWLFYDLFLPRPEIVEWWPPNLFEPLAIPVWILVGTWVMSLSFTRRPRDLAHLVIMCLTLWQALAHQRHIAFFSILCGFWLPVHVESVLRRMTVLKDSALTLEPSSKLRWGLIGGFSVAYCLLGWKLYERLHEMPVKRQEYPVSAFQYMADQHLTGKLVVTFNWAQYAIMAFGSRQPGDQGLLVQVDGRCRTSYSQEMLDVHFDFVLGDAAPGMRWRSPLSPPADPARALDYGRPDMVLLDRGQAHCEEVMKRHRDDWVLLYQDKTAQLWGRASRYDDPRNAAYIPPAQRQVTNEVQVGTVNWPALPVEKRQSGRGAKGLTELGRVGQASLRAPAHQ